jgi:hypothetical protein
MLCGKPCLDVKKPRLELRAADLGRREAVEVLELLCQDDLRLVPLQDVSALSPGSKRDE